MGDNPFAILLAMFLYLEISQTLVILHTHMKDELLQRFVTFLKEYQHHQGISHTIGIFLNLAIIDFHDCDIAKGSI